MRLCALPLPHARSAASRLPPRDQHEARGSLMTAGRQGWLLVILGVVFGAMIGEWLLR
jgi:hypothetical protein